MQGLENILEKISGIIWGNYLIITLIGVGLFFTILTKGIQIKGFPLAVRELINSLKGEKEVKGEGTLSSFQALCTALSSCVGNGNIVGVATAIASGGPGAVFWMWAAGIVGMATKYAEIVLGMIYREKAEDGTYVGGPMYYISKGLKLKKIAFIFALLMFLQISGGALIQSNAVAIVMSDIFKVKPIFSGILMGGVILSVVVGGVQRLGKVTERLLPVMALIYFFGGLVVIISNINHIPYAIMNIVSCAFRVEAVGGGVLGHTIKEAMRFGVARGLYSNEAGEGSANSCNDAMMQIGAKMGATQFIKAQSLFNFGTRTGIDLPNEGAGIIHTKDSMGETELACSAFGQGFTCTMIQEINAMSSVINGGYYYQPHLVTKVLDSNGGTVKTISPILLKQTISSRISSDIRSYMALSVQQGTSRHSKVQGYSSGGKTGTAEKYPRGNGKYLVSFIGFAPVDDPAVVIYVVVDEPNVEDQANSTYPQYIAQGILSELLPYLNVVPDESEDGTVPETELWEGFKGHLKSTSISDSELDSDGNLVDADGNLIDWDGNRIDENGYLLDANGDHILDEEGNYKMSTNLVSASGSTDADSSGDAVSNPDAPAPLEDDEAETTEDNDEETDGITNEEAGLE